MSRRGLAALALVAAVACRGVAQSPAIPDTPAGSVIRVWQEAFNSGDTLRILDYYRRFQPERIAQGTVNFRLASGGFDIVSIERSEPRHIELVVRERKTPATYYGVVDLAPSDPIKVAGSTLTVMGPNADLSQLRIDAAARAKVIDGAIALLDSFYVFPEVAKRIADSLRYWNAHGRYAGYAQSMSFAVKLNEDVRGLSHDKHMRVDYSVRPIPPRPAAPPPRTPEDIARDRAQVDQVNCAFQKVENLDGNIGYVKCARTAAVSRPWSATSRRISSRSGRTSMTSGSGAPAKPKNSGRATTFRAGSSAATSPSTS